MAKGQGRNRNFFTRGPMGANVNMGQMFDPGRGDRLSS